MNSMTDSEAPAFASSSKVARAHRRVLTCGVWALACLAGCSLWSRHHVEYVEEPAVASASAAEEGTLVITKGLSDNQVLQRDETGHAVIRCSGTSSVDGEIRAHLFATDKTGAKRGLVQILLGDMTVMSEGKVGESNGGKWSAEIAEVPTGGPYLVEFQLRDMNGRIVATTQARDILVGDLWILAGQSNMQGYGDMIDVESPSPYVHSFETRYDWVIAEEPLHRLTESPNPIHLRIFNPKMTEQEMKKIREAPRVPVVKGTGLGLPFAKELYERTKVPIGLVPCAHGGTSMDQWDPAARDQKGNSLYGSMYDRFLAVGGKVKGVLWYQGESDANPKGQPQYLAKFKRFIQAVRRDFGDAELPFYLVQISRVTLPNFDEKAWNGVQEDERRIGEEVHRVRTVSAIDLDLDDIIHIGTQGHKRLGRRFAVVADHDLFGSNKIGVGPHLRHAVLEEPGLIRVAFDNVNGSLSPPRHIAGFSLRLVDDKPGSDFYDVTVDPKQPNSVLCHFQGDLPAGASLWYGHGTNPYCNLVDEQDMAAPVFGPVKVVVPTTKPKP